MPPRTAKRKADDGSEAAKKKAKKESNMKLFEKMKEEAAENRRKAAAKKEEEAKQTVKGRRQTISSSSSSRRPSSSSGRRTSVSSSSSSRKTMTPSSSRRPEPPVLTSEESSSEEDDDDEEEDQFDRLVQQSGRQSLPSRPRPPPPSENLYAKVYAAPSSRGPSKRQQDFLKRQEELYLKAQRGYHSSDDSESEEESDEHEDETEREQEEVRQQERRKGSGKKSLLKVSPEKKPSGLSAVSSTSSSATTSDGRDEVSMMVESVMYSVLVFFLGALLVVGIYFTLTTVNLDTLFIAMFGSKFTELSNQIQILSKNLAMLGLVLGLLYGGIESFLWLNRRANSRKAVIAQLAKEAMAIIKNKLFYPSDFIMEEVLEKYDQLTLHNARVDRSMMKNLWPDVEMLLLEDARMQSSDHMFEGKKRRCLRYTVVGSVVSDSSLTPSQSVPPPSAQPRGQFKMF